LNDEENEKKIPPNPSCGYCDFGLVMAYSKHVNAEPFTFLCSCGLGHRRLEHYARWTSDHRNHYEILEPCTQSWSKNGPQPT
jgi:hypothetical protein